MPELHSVVTRCDCGMTATHSFFGPAPGADTRWSESALASLKAQIEALGPQRVARCLWCAPGLAPGGVSLSFSLERP
jgi:hypothetical protein